MKKRTGAERAGRNTQPRAMRRIDDEYLKRLPLEYLEAFFVLRVCPALTQTFHRVSRLARKAGRTKAQRLAVMRYEIRFKQALKELKATIDAYIYHAIFSEHDEQ